MIDLDQLSIDPVKTDLFDSKNLNVAILRLDRVHPVVSGNKWFKLRYYLEDAVRTNRPVVTFGGAWSNHLVAAAYASQLYGLTCHGIVRGEKPSALSPTLRDAINYGMHLHFTSRSDYREKMIPDHLLKSDPLIIPEGGFGARGAAGMRSVDEYCDLSGYDHICCAAGTGTMMAGIASASSATITGISVLKNNFQLDAAVQTLQPAWAECHFIHDYHFGGYAKFNAELLEFMNRWHEETGIPSDFVYTGKLFYAVESLARRHYFAEGARILLIHSGGLQGNRSLAEGTLRF